MHTCSEIESQLTRILPTVQKPGRYTGGELNQVLKNWETIQTRVALIFPDIYDLGMSNLGLAILYDLINQREDTLAERAFAPWIDMEAAMREKNLPLFSLESKRPLSDFDIIGFTLPYETLYTSTLNLLELSNLPIFSKDRTTSHPLIIAGGHATFNPEPMHPFIDAFVIGEGETIIHEIIDCYQSMKDQEIGSYNRKDILLAISKIPGVYVPSFYKANYNPDGTFSHLEKLVEEAPPAITKRIEPILPPPPTKFIVPYIDTVHNRVPIEIMRGCTRGCRFCHAGMVNRPVRERPISEIIKSIDMALKQTGYEEVGLLSLSSSDFSQIIDLIKEVNEYFCGDNLSISLPSLRIESVSVNLMDALQHNRRSGFTLAPEAATERIRNIINKPIESMALLETAKEIYSRGWHTIKLYFMIGHPTETLEDVDAIVHLCKEVREVGRGVIGKRATVHASVSTFVPKPHTPFQWIGCDKIEKIEKKLDHLRKNLRGQGLKLNWNDPRETQLEALLSRGDRKIAQVIYQAWMKGAKFDAWNEHFNYSAWMDSCREVGIDPDFYANRHRPIDEMFPWEHISTSVTKKFLTQDYLWSLEGKIRIDCREKCFACGVLPTYNQYRQDYPGDHWRCPEVTKKTISINK